MVQGLAPDGCKYLAGKVVHNVMHVGCHVCRDPLSIASALLRLLWGSEQHAKAHRILINSSRVTWGTVVPSTINAASPNTGAQIQQPLPDNIRAVAWVLTGCLPHTQAELRPACTSSSETFSLAQGITAGPSMTPPRPAWGPGCSCCRTTSGRRV